MPGIASIGRRAEETRSPARALLLAGGNNPGCPIVDSRRLAARRRRHRAKRLRHRGGVEGTSSNDGAACCRSGRAAYWHLPGFTSRRNTRKKPSWHRRRASINGVPWQDGSRCALKGCWPAACRKESRCGMAASGAISPDLSAPSSR